jgi:GNAT superfamily N-acetyltransferase
MPAKARCITMLNTLRSYILTGLADLRYQGLEVLLWRIAVKLSSPLVRLDLQILFDFDLTQALEARPAKIDCQVEPAGEADIDSILDMQMRRLTPEEVALLSGEDEIRYAVMLRARANARDTYRRSMAAGERCYVARHQGLVVHSNWIRFADCGPMEGRPVFLRAGEVYTTDAFTMDDFRGQGVHEVVLVHMLQVARQRGCHLAYTITDFTKAGSRRGVKRVGWRRRGLIMYVTPRGFGRTFLVKLGGDLTPMFDQARATIAAGR